MPVEIQQIERDIFLLEWVGEVTIAEIRQSHEDTLALTVPHGIEHYVHIISGQRLGRVPLQMQDMYKVLRNYPGVVAIMGIHVPAIGHVLVRIISKIPGSVPIEVHNSLDDAVARAREILTTTLTT
ncbi:MAG: hypothetical protein AAF787_09925 [Chloroflexota bacterium]